MRPDFDCGLIWPSNLRLYVPCIHHGGHRTVNAPSQQTVSNQIEQQQYQITRKMKREKKKKRREEVKCAKDNMQSEHFFHVIYISAF